MHKHQAEIISDLGVKPEIDPAAEIEARIHFLTTALAETGLRGYTLGISGGQDSLLAGWLAQQAVRRRRDQGHNAAFHAVLLPYGVQRDRADALAALDFIGPDVIHDLNIKPATDAFAATYAAAEGRPLRDFDKGNVKARMRMIAQYAIASEHQLLVVGTDHAAEAVAGFFTKYGDGGADILPLSGLDKRQGRQLLHAIGAPGVFATKTPTADLLDTNPGQADEYELGILYDENDDYLEGKKIDESVAKKIEDRYFATAHKRALPLAYTNR